MNSTFLSSNSKLDFCYTMANISPSHVQRHALLSPLHNNFISFLYFFPSYETCSININSLFHAAIKNLHIKANGIFVFFILLCFTNNIIMNNTHARTHPFAKSNYNIYSIAKPVTRERSTSYPVNGRRWFKLMTNILLDEINSLLNHLWMNYTLLKWKFCMSIIRICLHSFKF